MAGIAHFLSQITDEFKKKYSRAMYKLLAKRDLAFRHGAKDLHLGDDCNVDDRFVFLFICKKMLEHNDEELAHSFYILRATGFNFVVTEQSGISIRPNERWNTAGDGEPSNSVENFMYAWRLSIPQAKREWIKTEFESMEHDFPEFAAVA